MSEMTPEIEAQYREAQERIAAAKRASVAPRGPDAIAALMASFEALPDEADDLEERNRRAERREQRAREAERAGIERRIRQAIHDVPVTAELAAAIVAGGVGTTQALTAVRGWREAKGKPVLVLLGGVGTGKTVAAAWAIAEGARESSYHNARYAKIRDLANLYRAGFGKDQEEFDRCMGASLLVIDELTTERDADLGRACLHEIIDWRGSKGAPTLLLANRTKAEIAKHYDPRTIDRLRECAAVVELAGKSMRKGAW